MRRATRVVLLPGATPAPAGQKVAIRVTVTQAYVLAVRRATMPGVDGSPGKKNPMHRVNLAWTPVLTWADPAQTRLERPALIPRFSDRTVKRSMAGREDELFARIATDTRFANPFTTKETRR